MGSKAFNGARSEKLVMAQGLKTAKGIPDEEFTRLAKAVIGKNKELLDMLAKV